MSGCIVGRVELGDYVYKECFNLQTSSEIGKHVFGEPFIVIISKLYFQPR